MKPAANKSLLCLLITISSLLLCLWLAPAALAAADYIIDGSGGDCVNIGTWDSSTKTCTLTGDVIISGGNDGIEIVANDITLEGNGFNVTYTGAGGPPDGVVFHNRASGRVKNLNVRGFYDGFHIDTSSNVSVYRCISEVNRYGVYVNGGSGNDVSGSDIRHNSSAGLDVTSSANFSGYENDFISNAPGKQAEFSSTSSVNFFNNYWDDWDSRVPPENCVNTTPFDTICDTPYIFTGGSDAQPYVFRDKYSRRDWTWYDNVGGSNWVLLANSSDSGINNLYSLMIDGQHMDLPALPGFNPGQVPPGRSITPVYPGLIGGPVTANGYEGGLIASQRILWPKGGNSLEELPGTDFEGFHANLFWTWYDMASPGYKNWVLISNINDYQINYEVRIAGVSRETGTIAAGGRVTPWFPGVIGGPVEVDAWNDFGDPVYIMASQRVLSNGDTAFNEQPGIPVTKLASDYVWTWYDMASPGARNWVLVANPPGAPTPIYYEVWIAGTKVNDGGPIAPGGNETPTFPGTIGGPVEVKTFSDAAHTVAANSIASQRIIWGPSFGEVSGQDASTLRSGYSWTWYDMASPGARNWVLVANPPDATGPIYYEILIGGSMVKSGGPIPPGGNEAPVFPGTIGGPVEVSTYSDPARSVSALSIVSQRVLWNGYFNEVWGQ